MLRIRDAHFLCLFLWFLLLFAVGDGNHSLATAKEHWNKIKATLTEEEQIVRNESNGISKVYNYSYTTEYVIINEELDYVPLSEYTGTTLYVSEDCASNGNSKESKSGDPKPIPIAAFFAFNPNEEKTYNSCIKAVKQDGLMIAYVPSRFMSESLCKIAIN